VASDGVAHVIYVNIVAQENLRYTCRGVDGAWSIPETLGQGRAQFMQVDATGALHAIWWWGHFVYVRRSSAGVWSAQEIVPGEVRAQLAVDSAGTVHVVWGSWAGAGGYAQRDPSGQWSPTARLNNIPYLSNVGTVAPIVDANGVVHTLVWGAQHPDDCALVYVSIHPDGRMSWSEVGRAGYITGVALVLDAQGRAHALWHASQNSHVFYARQTQTGGWSAQTLITDLGAFPEWGRPGARLAVDSAGLAHVVFGGAYGEVFYRRQDADGVWSAAENISLSPYTGSGEPCLIVDPADVPRVAFIEGSAMAYADPLAPATGDARLRQTLTIPANMAGAKLSFFYRPSGTLTAANAFKAQIGEGAAAQTVVTCTTASGDWVHVSVDVSAYAGRSVPIQFGVHQTAARFAGWVDLDEVTVGTGPHPDLFAVAGSQVAAPGETITLTLRYGNRGAAPAAGAVVSLTLPATLTFVSADPPPATPALTWQLGDLESGASGSIQVIATMSAEVPPGTIIALPFGVETAGGEVVLEDNQGLLRIFAGGVGVWLPRMVR